MRARFCLGVAWCAAMVAGCGSQSIVPSDLVANGTLKVEAMPAKQVVLSPPTVLQDGKELLITGVVTRKPGVDTPIEGHLDLVVVSAKGEYLDNLLLGWTPREIPVAGERRARYRFRWAYLPPPGSVLRVGLSKEFPPSMMGAAVGVGGVRDYGRSAGIGLGATRTPSQPSGRPSQPSGRPSQPGGIGRW